MRPRTGPTRRGLGALAAGAATLAGTHDAAAQGGSPYYSGPISDHFDGTRFFNPSGAGAPKTFADQLRWRFGPAGVPWPDAYPSPYGSARPSRAEPGALRATLVGHATWLIQQGGLAILTDPVWSERASPFGFVGPRRANPPGIAFDDLPRIDAVLISHNHYDHLDLATLSRLWARDRPRIVAPLGNDAIIRAHDPAIAVTALDWGGRVPLDAGGTVTATAVPVEHWSARWLDDRNGALWTGYVLAGGGRRVFFAGDTGFGEGRPFRDVPARHGALDLALLPIGAYEPRWFMAGQHMNPDDAVAAFGLLGARQALGYHWGTFDLTDEAVDAPPRDLAAVLSRRGVPQSRFLAARPGQVWAA